MMRVLLLGAAGQVGRELAAMLPLFAQVAAPSRQIAPLDDLDRLRKVVRDARPHVVVNAASWNDVDGAERDEAGAMRVNRDAVALLGEEVREAGAFLIHYSTDYVFDGTLDRPYTEDDPVSPLSAYARSKVAGEQALVEMDAPAIVLRTAWVYSMGRKCFLSQMLRAAREREELRVADDQFGSPTFARDLAAATALILRGAGSDGEAVVWRLRRERGIYHATGTGGCSRHTLIERALLLDPRRGEHTVKQVTAVKSDVFQLPAPRPHRVVLDKSRLRDRFGITLPPWGEALARALDELRLYQPG